MSSQSVIWENHDSSRVTVSCHAELCSFRCAV
jgi:hypothetical protein